MASQQPEKAQDPVEQGQNAPEASEEAHREVIDVNAAENQEAVIIDDPIGSRESAQREALAQELESGEVQEEENPLGS